MTIYGSQSSKDWSVGGASAWLIGPLIDTNIAMLQIQCVTSYLSFKALLSKYSSLTMFWCWYPISKLTYGQNSHDWWCHIQRVSFSDERYSKSRMGCCPWWHDLLLTVKRLELSWFGHVCRHDMLAKIILQKTVHGRCCRGRPCKSCKDNIKEWTGQSISSLLRIADDRSRWAVITVDAFVGVRQRRLFVTALLSLLAWWCTCFSALSLCWILNQHNFVFWMDFDKVLEGRRQFVQIAGNMSPITKSNELLSVNFRPFRENRLPLVVRIKDLKVEPTGQAIFVPEPVRGPAAESQEPPGPICVLRVTLPGLSPSQGSDVESRDGHVDAAFPLYSTGRVIHLW